MTEKVEECYVEIFNVLITKIRRAFRLALSLCPRRIAQFEMDKHGSIKPTEKRTGSFLVPLFFEN
jgi:hypothetical protein